MLKQRLTQSEIFALEDFKSQFTPDAKLPVRDEVVVAFIRQFCDRAGVTPRARIKRPHVGREWVCACFYFGRESDTERTEPDISDLVTYESGEKPLYGDCPNWFPEVNHFYFPFVKEICRRIRLGQIEADGIDVDWIESANLKGSPFYGHSRTAALAKNDEGRKEDRIFLYLVKPNQRRYWSNLMAINDGDWFAPQLKKLWE